MPRGVISIQKLNLDRCVSKWTALDVNFRHRGQCATLACSDSRVEQHRLAGKRQQTPACFCFYTVQTLARVAQGGYHLAEVLANAGRSERALA